jgi:hypothetical protein
LTFINRRRRPGALAGSFSQPSSAVAAGVSSALKSVQEHPAMIESLSGIFTAFGLSSSAGLNAYLPLLIVALTARFTNLITLHAPFDWLTNVGG